MGVLFSGKNDEYNTALEDHNICFCTTIASDITWHLVLVASMFFQKIIHMAYQYRMSGIPACALQGIAARWLNAHYKTIARSIARYGSGSWVCNPMS